MANLSAEGVIRREHHSKNALTPDVIRYGWILLDRLAYELSRGEGWLTDSPLYGVSVVRYTKGRTNREGHPLSNAFPALRLAERHIEQLRRLASAVPAATCPTSDGEDLELWEAVRNAVEGA